MLQLLSDNPAKPILFCHSLVHYWVTWGRKCEVDNNSRKRTVLWSPNFMKCYSFHHTCLVKLKEVSVLPAEVWATWPVRPSLACPWGGHHHQRGEGHYLRVHSCPTLCCNVFWRAAVIGGWGLCLWGKQQGNVLLGGFWLIFLFSDAVLTNLTIFRYDAEWSCRNAK